VTCFSKILKEKGRLGAALFVQSYAAIGSALGFFLVAYYATNVRPASSKELNGCGTMEV
jgi:hypothetical protein